MSTVTLKLQKTDSDFIKVAGSMVEVGDRRWYHLPFWYEEIGDGLFVEHRFEDLPVSLKERIQGERENASENEAKELADKIWNETVGKEELMYCEITEPKIHTKHDLCEAMGCVKYDEKIHKQ